MHELPEDLLKPFALLLVGGVAGLLEDDEFGTWDEFGDCFRATDRGDASGTGYWSPMTGEYRYDQLHSNVPGVNYNANVFLVGLKLQR